MPDLLLELFSEEIPARMQARAADDLKKLVTDALVERGLVYEGAEAFATPRRLALVVAGLPAKGRDTREERKGPRVGAPEAAIQGFLKSAGLASLDQATIQRDPKKGDSYIAVIEKPGRATGDVLAEVLPAIIRAFPWPKSMRWGAASGPAGQRYRLGEGRGPEALRWVRPLKAILCTLDDANGEPVVVPFVVDGIAAGDVTYGHPFLHGPAPIRARRFEEYEPGLRKAHVMLRPDLRRREILRQAKELCEVQGLELVPDDGLLDEVTGLVEWPVCLMGSFDEAFLAVPEQAIRATIRANQKCFVVRDPATGRLANRFIATANTEATDGGATIIAGNARVIRARLSDARFFFETDLKVPLDERLEKLKTVRFHEKLGTQMERVERIAALARELAPAVGADPDKAERAARLAKADLATEMVGEFPELQGLMGRIYATHAGEDVEVAAAIEEHYKPQGPADRVPSAPVSIAVALADKLDTLVGFWAIDEKPTGSKDPYALRRAALGVIRLVVENGVALPLGAVMTAASPSPRVSGGEGPRVGGSSAPPSSGGSPHPSPLPAASGGRGMAADLLAFFHDRLKVMLKDQGRRHDLVDAVLAAGAIPAREGEGREPAANDDLTAIVRRVEALSDLLATEDGANLLAGYKRAANILRAEEKKDGEGAFDRPVEAARLMEPEERALAAALDGADAAVEAALAGGDYAGAMRAMAALRPAVDAFFETILVNAEDAALRANRLALLAKLRAVTRPVADLSKVAG